MIYQIQILRQKGAQSEPYLQDINYEISDPEMSVAVLLKTLNADSFLKDIDGQPVGKIEWECSCLQKKCGACAMRIGGKPRLACDVKLKEIKNGKLLLEPLKKFPVIRDLIVDRSVMFENLKQINLWFDTEAGHPKKSEEIACEASRCLQCGCCLEVCPNFIPGDSFFAAAAFVPAARILSKISKQDNPELISAYQQHIYRDCGKALSCRDICPAGIDTDSLLVNNNAVAIWKRFFKR